MRTCEAKDCSGKHFARGLCQKHYFREHRQCAVDACTKIALIGGYCATHAKELIPDVYAAGQALRNNHGRKNHAKWRAQATPDEIQDRYLRSTYDLTLDEYHAMSLAQGHVCAVCGREDTSKKRRLHVDHRHTGKPCKRADIRGLLCHHCNAALGQLRDSVDVLQKAIDYLTRVG
jgi:hypothetical protein